jgi:hypothetical protein
MLDLTGGPTMEAIAWVVLGATTFIASLRAGGNARARMVARVALFLLFVFAGALVNAIYLVTGTDYADFADLSYLPFVTDTWHAVVAPNQELFIGLLVAFEAIAGTLILLGGRKTQIGLVAVIGFHVALLSFGWMFSIWSIPMLIALVLLLRAERAALAESPDGVADETPAPARPRRKQHV